MALSTESLSFLERCTWPSVLTHSEREQVYGAFTERSHQPGQNVCHQSEIADSWIGVVDGFMRVQTAVPNGDLVMFTSVASGGWIGEGSLLKIELRKYEIIATRPTKTLHLPRATFLWLLDTSVPFNRFVINHLNERLGQFMGAMMFDRLLQPTARVARCIANLFNPILYPNTVAVLRINQEEISRMAGVSRPRVNQALKILQERGLLEIGYASITALDLPGLMGFE